MTEGFFLPAGIYYRISEFRRGRRTLVFVHGLAGSSSAWRPYEKIWAGDYNLVAVDLLGHGQSRKSPAPADYQIRRLAQGVAELLDFLGVEKYILISHSFGTLIGLELLHLRPLNIEGKVFLSPTSAMGKTGLAKFRPVFAGLVKIFGWLPETPKPGRHIDYSRYPNAGDWGIRLNWADLRNTSWRVYFYCLLQVYNYREGELWEQIRVPVIILHGDRDSVVSIKSAKALAREIKNCRFAAIPGGNHLFVLNDAGGTAKVIQDFLDALPV